MRVTQACFLVAMIATCASEPASANRSAQVELLSGATTDGKLIELLPERVVLENADGTKIRLPLDDVLAIAFNDAPTTRPSPTNIIELIDGSRLRSQDFLVEQTVAKVILQGTDSLSLPASVVNSVRFGALAVAAKGLSQQDGQWQEIIDSQHEGDTLVLRKRSGALDFLEGVVGNVTTSLVSFSFDGTNRKVSRDKLEGFLYYHPHKRKFPASVATVIDTTSGRWQANKLVATDDGLQISLCAGSEYTMPWSSVARIDYGAAKIVFLSDIEPIRETWTPFIQASVVHTASERLFRPRRNRSLDGGELSLYYPSSKKTKTYHRGLAVQSRTEIEFQLNDNFRRLQAVAGINARMRRHGDVRLQVLADGRTILDVPIRGSDEPTQLDLDIDGSRRIGLVVDFGDNLDVADHLNLCNLQVIK